MLLDPGAARVRTARVLVRPRGPLPRAVARLTGLREADFAGAPALEAVRPALRELLAGRVIVAHNAEFEQQLPLAPDRPGARRRRVPRQPRPPRRHPPGRAGPPPRVLHAHAARERGAPPRPRRRPRHRAGDLRGGRRRGAGRGALPRRRARPRELRAGLALAGAPRQGGAAGAPPRALALRGGRRDGRGAGALRARGHRSGAPGRGPRARHFPGYRVREEQVRLALRFAKNLADDEVLLAEGGTGVGKSLAYLAAAIPFALERAAAGSAAPIVISTRTKLLQDQLLGKDIGAAARFLGHPAAARALDQGPRQLRVRAAPRGGARRGPRRAALPRAPRRPRGARRLRAHASLGRDRQRAGGAAAPLPAAPRAAAPLGGRARRALHAASSARRSAGAPSAGAARPSPRRTSWSRTTICCCAGRPTTRRSST